jgi:PAS domain S-box-containing protein
VLATVLDTTERVLEDRRRQVLRDLASRTAGARNEEEVWRVSAETLGQDRLSLPFAFLYEYRPSEHRAYLAGASVETDGALHPGVIDCRSENLWRFDPALTRDGVILELGNRASRVSVANWPAPPKEASVVPIRLGEYSEALGFLVVGIHPGRAFDDAYRQFVYQITEHITIGLASASAYEQERQRADALAELDRAKTTFFSNISHEFRTPLTLMLCPLEEVLPKARERLSPEDHEQLAAVRRNGLRLLKLVNTLLDFSRIEAGRLQASYQPTDLAGFTSEIASAFDSAMENAGLRFSVECQPITEPVFVDRDMWEKMVLNLLSNAFKFTFGGEVAVTLRPVDGTVELQVRDTGVGIPEEHRERVFERFHRIEGTHARTYEGTGIGLALVQELVKLHGGTVRVESALGKGSTFTVTIPSGRAHLPAGRIQAAQSFASTKIRAEAYVEEAQQWLGDESGAAVDIAMLGKLPLLTSSSEPEPAGKRELIVMADDNADMRQYLMHLLGDRYEVHAVADGRQALEATRQLRPALVLADVMMPRLDGFGLLRAIRDDSALASTPVMLVSARAGEESRVEGLQATADDYLVKPFTAQELLARVATHVKMAHLRRVTAEREERLRNEAEIERQKLHASQELLAETSRLYRELQDREAKIRRLVEANVVGIVMWNLEGAITGANDAFLRMVGYDREDLASGRVRWTDLTPTEWRDRDARALVELTKVGTVQPYEKEFFRKNGGRIPVLAGGALFEESGHEGVAFVLDLSEQKRAEEALRQSEQRWRTAFENSAISIMLRNLEGRFIAANSIFQNMLGYTESELCQLNFVDVTHEEDRKAELQLIGEILQGKRQHYQIEKRYRRKDGALLWVRNNVALVPGMGDAAPFLFAVVEDITQRKQEESARRYSEERHRVVVETANDAVVSAYESGAIQFANPATTRVFGYDPAELIGKPLTVLMPELMRKLHENGFRRYLATGQRHINWQGTELTGLRKNGQEFPVEVSFGELTMDGRRVFTGFIRDISERKQAEEQREKLRRAQADLAHINRVSTMGELTASLGHEIKQPITAAITDAQTCVGWLARERPEVAEAREAASRFIKDVTRAKEIIGRIASLYKKHVPNRELIDVNELIREMIVLMRSEASRYSISIHGELADGLPKIMADRVGLQQVLMNLMLNGVEAMKDMTTPGTLTIMSKRSEDGELAVSILDTGVGVPPEQIDQIFSAFVTSKAQGTGMGLPISRSIIESHGGRLWATPNTGPGSTFQFVLPIEPSAHQTA